MSMFTELLKQEEEKKELEAKHAKELKEAREIKDAELLQPLYDEFKSGLNGMIIPSRTMHFNNYADRPVFEEFRSYGDDRKLNAIFIDELRIRPSNEFEGTFVVCVNYKNEKTGLNADQVRSLVAEYIVRGFRRGTYKRKSD